MLVLLIWLLIGVAAGGQRDYYAGPQRTCAHAGTVIATILAGPLNYVGVNPKVHCQLLEPSS
jgi:hypothetical protein